MSRRRNRLLKRMAIAIALFAIIPYLISGCFSFRMSPKEVKQYYAGVPVKPTLTKVKTETWDINFAQIGADTLPMVIFIHGAPGSWSAFRAYLKDSNLYSIAHLISVDRPGYGYSDFGRVEPSLEKQSELLSILFKYNKSNKPVILVGHSLGGPVAARMAMDYPDKVGGLILVAPSIDPDLEPKEWYRLPLSLPLVRWILPVSFDMTNREIYHLKDELTFMLPMWPKIKSPTIVIQGENDDLVDPGNAEFAEKMITNAPVEVVFRKNTDHFIPWTKPQLIDDAIEESISKLKKLN